MTMTRNRMNTIGWGMALSICFALTMILTSYVNAVKSKVRLVERDIVAVELEKQELETEFETRSRHDQLEAFNHNEFGYEAPRPEQYLQGERQLAMLGTPRGKDAPAPIRVASVDAGEGASGPAVRALPETRNPDTNIAQGSAPQTRTAQARVMPVLAVLRDEVRGPAPHGATRARAGDLAARLSQPARPGANP